MFYDDLNEKEKIIDSLKYENSKCEIIKSSLPDSFAVYRNMYKHIQDRYGIIQKFSLKDRKIIFDPQISRADSALILFPYYKKYIKRDSLGNWIITTDKIVVPKVEIEKNKRKPFNRN